MLSVPYELVGVDHAGYAAFSAASRFIRAYYPPFTLEGYVLFSARYFWRQRNFKLHGRSNIQRSVGADVDAGGAQVSGCSLCIAARLCFMNLNRQMQGKPFSCPCFFGHSSSSVLAWSVIFRA